MPITKPYIRKGMLVDYHNKSKSPEYRSWDNMIARCERPSNPEYKNYGGKGINVCSKWRKSFTAFYKDVGDKPSPSHTLDRIDNNKSYEPNNVKWSSKLEQTLNQRIRKDNKSGLRGVRFNKIMNKWSAEVTTDGKNIYLGCYKTKEEAGYVRDQVALQLWGNKAKLNYVYSS